MTNDVKKIKNKYAPEASRTKILVEIYKKNPNLDDVLCDSVSMELEKLYLEDRDNAYSKTIKSYEALYKMADIPMPEIFLNINTRDDFHKFFRV